MSSSSIPLDDATLARRQYEESRTPAGSPLRYYGMVPDDPDPRDYIFAANPDHVLSQLVDLREDCPEVYNQWHMGSCTANAVAGAFGYIIKRKHLTPFSPSRLFIWCNARAAASPENVKMNVGCQLRITIKSLDLKSNGVCSEELWSYEDSAFDKKTRIFNKGAKAAQEPSPEAKDNGHKHTATSIEYATFRTDRPGDPGFAEQLMQSLDRGAPFVFSLIYVQILHGLSPEKPTPDWPTKEQTEDLTHRHALMAVGYDKAAGHFIIRNSWGADWGDKGHFYLPFDFLDLCQNFWSIQAVESSE